MCNILITGANGQLGRELKALVDSGIYVINSKNTKYFFTDRNSLNITNKTDVKNFIETNDINIIVNTAAYTAVDKAEEDKKIADQVNHLAVKYLAQISKEKNISLIHISTDYVFDGKNHKPYNEYDLTNPNGAYGYTKLAGEKAMQVINPKKSIIIRTSWVYSSFGSNFVKSILHLSKDKKSIGIIFDQIGTPTYAKDLAKTILDISQSIKNKEVRVYNYSNEGVLSWYDFAKEVVRLAKVDCKINPIETKDYPTLATRPHYSVLNKSKIKKEFGIIIPYWKDSLSSCLKVLGYRNK